MIDQIGSNQSGLASEIRYFGVCSGKQVAATGRVIKGGRVGNNLVFRSRVFSLVDCAPYPPTLAVTSMIETVRGSPIEYQASALLVTVELYA